jgi:GxxExxY protein
MNELTEIIIGCAYTVANKLGTGFLEKVYENALALELAKQGLKVEQQKPMTVYYDDQIVGEYFADMLINEEIVVELKASKAIEQIHQAQLLNYLRASNKQIGLLLNFGSSKVDVKRMIV